MMGYGRKRPIPDPPEWTSLTIHESVTENRGSRWTLRLDVHGLPHLDPKYLDPAYGPMERMFRSGLNEPQPPWRWG